MPAPTMRIRSPVSEPAAQIVRELQRLERQHATEQGELADRQRQERLGLIARMTLTAEPKPSATALPTDLLKPKEAQREFHLSKASLFRLGEKYPELCFFNEQGARMYSKSLLDARLKVQPLRRQRVRKTDHACDLNGFRSRSDPK
jgi:hypothetical protein